MSRLASMLCALALGTLGSLGCVQPEEQLGATEQAEIECDTWICGSNSPILGGLRFHELNIAGLLNTEGFSILNFSKAGTPYELSVERGRIIGRSGSLMIHGSGLVGAQLKVRRGIQVFAIRISGVHVMQSYARMIGTTRAIETYFLEAAEYLNGQLADFRNLCGNVPSPYHADLLGMTNTHALVFEGDRISKTAKTIDLVADPSWFNLGCAGHALAKLAINTHTYAAKVAYGFATTTDERQAFLKMLTADYCGKGRTFTISGQRVQWRDAHGYTQYASDPVNLELEARWGANGATCLDTPRLIANPSVNGAAIFGDASDILDAIQAECDGALPPSCAGGVTNLGGEYLVSANPL